MSDEQINTSNDQLVGVRGHSVIVVLPRTTMTPAEARRHVAWLAVMADVIDNEPTTPLADVIRAVEGS